MAGNEKKNALILGGAPGAVKIRTVSLCSLQISVRAGSMSCLMNVLCTEDSGSPCSNFSATNVYYGP